MGLVQRISVLSNLQKSMSVICSISAGACKVIRAFFRINLLLKEEIDCGDDQVGNDVKGSNAQENVGIVKWHLFRHLHHAKNDHQVGAVGYGMSSVLVRLRRQYDSRHRNDLLTFAGSTPWCRF